jgi:hypothetical protein
MGTFSKFAQEKSKMVCSTLPRCMATTRAGTPCRKPAITGWPYCVKHSTWPERIALGLPVAEKCVARNVMLDGAPACLRRLPLWRQTSAKMRVALLEGWFAEVNDGQHGAWWAAVMRVLEWREVYKTKVPRDQWPKWLLRPFEGTGGAAPIPPRDTDEPLS